MFFGAGDLRFMRNVTIVAAVLGYLPLAVAALGTPLGLAGVWFGLSAFIWMRLAAVLEVAWKRWLVGGAELADERLASRFGTHCPGVSACRIDSAHRAGYHACWHLPPVSASGFDAPGYARQNGGTTRWI